VPANPDRLRFYVDESALGLGKTLAAARDDVIRTRDPGQWFYVIYERSITELKISDPR
jgi:hypothetical protein